MLHYLVSDPTLRAGMVISLVSLVTNTLGKIALDALSQHTLLPYLIDTIQFRELDSINLSQKIVHILSFIIWLIVMRSIGSYYARRNIQLNPEKVSAIVAASYTFIRALLTLDNLDDPTTIAGIVLGTVLTYFVTRKSLKSSDHKSF